MTTIRPLERADVPEVCGLFERVSRSGGSIPPRELVTYFERTLLDHPWVDPDVPSMVYSNSDGRIVAFIASHARRLRLDGEPVRMVYTGPFLADPDPTCRGAGALLLRRFLDGPQDLTMTDAGNDILRALSEKLGARTVAHLTVRWTRLLRPFGTGAAVVSRRGQPSALKRSLVALAGPLDAVSTAVAGRVLNPATATEGEPLTIPDIVALMPKVAQSFDLHVDYDEPFLSWLFRELSAVEVLGAPVANLVRTSDGGVAGWYVYYLVPGGFARVLQVAAFGDDAGVVLDHLFRDAASGGAVAVGGRVEAHLLPALFDRRCAFHRSTFSSFVLAHSRRPDMLAAVGCGRALLSRLDGESWMGYRILWRGDDTASRNGHRASPPIPLTQDV